MIQGIGSVIYPVKNAEQAKRLFTTMLGVEPYFDAPYYVGYSVGGQEIGLDPNGHKEGMTGPVTYFTVADVKESLQALLDGGAQTLQDVRDVGGGKLIATVGDMDGNVIGLVQSI